MNTDPTWRREWWQDDSVELFRLPDGTFPRWEHKPGYGTVHGDQYMPPWYLGGWRAYFTSDFGELILGPDPTHKSLHWLTGVESAYNAWLDSDGGPH